MPVMRRNRSASSPRRRWKPAGKNAAASTAASEALGRTASAATEALNRSTAEATVALNRSATALSNNIATSAAAASDLLRQRPREQRPPPRPHTAPPSR